jgi:diguanylate cyclase (GGDEF)-like protein
MGVVRIAPGSITATPRVDRLRRLSDRERAVEAAAAGLLGFAVAVLLMVSPPLELGALDLAGLVLFYACCARVHVYVGGGSAVVTQLALVPMLFLLPAALVPVAVAAGLVLATLVDLIWGREHPERLLTAVVDAWYAVAPAAVFAVGTPEAALLVPAFAAQAAADTGCTLLRESLGRGVAPLLQLRTMGWIYGIDAALTPVGWLALATGPRGWLLLVPLVGLHAALTADRSWHLAIQAERTEELHRERERLRFVLDRMAGALAANLDRRALLDAVHDIGREALEADELVPAAEPALERAALAARPGGGTVATAADGWHVLARHLHPEPEPLVVARESRAFTHDEMELFDRLADQAAISLENARLHMRVSEQATHDGLTGLANRRALTARLDQGVTGMSLVLLDLDDFKRVNDRHGHLVGDEVLRAVGRVVRRRCRATDLPARYGGEEIAIALPRTDAAGATRLAQAVLREIEALDFDGIHVTASAGVATGADSPTGLVAAADAMLYEAKRAGKNRVASPLLAV